MQLQVGVRRFKSFILVKNSWNEKKIKHSLYLTALSTVIMLNIYSEFRCIYLDDEVYQPLMALVVLK